MAPARGRSAGGTAVALVLGLVALVCSRLRGRHRGQFGGTSFLVPPHLAVAREDRLVHQWGHAPALRPQGRLRSSRRAQVAGLEGTVSANRGWQRFNDRQSWAFLLGASPFSYSEVVANTRREKYMDNLVWMSQREVSSGDGNSTTYSPAFVSYLSRLLLARDARCFAWWKGALEASDEAPELFFGRFQASVAATLRSKWASSPGSLAAALIKRFGGRFPFDAVPQVRLLFSLLTGSDKPRDSFFDQAFSTDRDELMEVFLVMDADGNGMLNATEIQDTIERLGGGWLSNAETEQMLGEALANSDGEVDFNGFKEAITNSHKASRARAARGWSSDEWWRDPAALLPANMLDAADSSVLIDAHTNFEQVKTAASAAREHPPKEASPLVREHITWRVYLLLMLAGAFACTITHVALVPIDVVKTLQQTEPDQFQGAGLLTATFRLFQMGGLPLLFLGLVPTCVGYLWYGAMVFPLYELFKRKLLALAGSHRRTEDFRVPITLLSGALATFFACIGVCPAEAVRIRTVTEHGFQLGFVANLASLYAGFAPLLFRQVLFGMAKFLVFDTVQAAALRLVPWFKKNMRTMLLCSLLSGASAGLTATFVSQPSDAILTRVASSSGSLGIWGAATSLLAKGGLGAFFAGFGTRAIWASCIIAGQFLFYDVAKQVFKATASDLTQTADVVTTALKTREPALEFGANQLEAGATPASAASASPASATPALSAWPSRGAAGKGSGKLAVPNTSWLQRLPFRTRRNRDKMRALGGDNVRAFAGPSPGWHW